MWVFTSAAHRSRLVPLWGGRWHELVPASGLGSQSVSYSVTACLRGPGDGGVKPAASHGRRDHGRSAQSKAWKKEIPALQRKSHGKGDVQRISSELRKLSLEDSPAEGERMRTPRATTRATTRATQKLMQDSEAESHEIVFGISPCLLALTQGRRKAQKLFVKDGEASHRASVLKVCEEACRRGVQVQRVSKKHLDTMSSGRVHQGVCLQASPLGFLTADREPAPRGKDAPLWLVLDRIQDPMNLGAILRSSYFLGVDRVASSLHHSCPLSPVVSKASSGTMEVLGVYGYPSLEDMLKLKVAQGWQVVGTVGADAHGSGIPVTRCSDFQMTKPTLLLIGSEGEGLSQELLSLCQTWLTIPAGRTLFPGVESLNVAVATGILLHTLLSSR